MGQKIRPIKNSPEAHNTPLPPPVAMTPEQIAQEEAVRAQLIQKLKSEEAAANARLAGTKPTAAAPSDALAALAHQLAAGEEAAIANDRERHRVVNGPKVAKFRARLEAAKKGIRELRAQHLTAATDLARLDEGALKRAFRFVVTPGSTVTGAERISLLKRAAQTLVDALRDSFTTADDALMRSDQSASADPESQEWHMAYNWAERQVATVETNLRVALAKIQNVTTLQARVTEDMKLAERIAPQDQVAPPRIDWLPNIPEKMRVDGSDSAYQDFDPRRSETMIVPTPPSQPKSLPEGPFKDQAKIVGIAGQGAS